MSISSDMNIYFNALGMKEGSNNILDAIKIIAMDFCIDEYDNEDESKVYYIFSKSGVDFSFKKASGDFYLESIFFYLDDKDRVTYPSLNNLIPGVTYLSQKNDVLMQLGSPEKNGTNWIRYEHNGKYIHFEFNSEGNIKMISLFIDVL